MEGLGSLAEVSGLPRSYVQLLAWLVVCEPPHQSVEQLQAALGLSAGAISMATAALVRMGVAERISQPGERRLYYRFHPRGWERTLRLRLEAVARGRAVAEEALAHAPEPSPRLAEMHDVYAWFEDRIAGLLSDGRVERGP